MRFSIEVGGTFTDLLAADGSQVEVAKVPSIPHSPDSAGDGATRGGLGFLRRFQILTDNVSISLYSNRLRRPPEGRFGGAPGSTGFREIQRGNEIIPLKSKDKTKLRKGDIVTLGVSGGGGYGLPANRAAKARETDRMESYVTAA